MILRDCIHAVGRLLTRFLLHPRWRNSAYMSSAYLHLYLLGKALAERRELTRLRSLIVPGMVIVDVGANVGFYTLEMAAWVGPGGRILAFEPDPVNYRLLQTRVAKAMFTNIDLYRVALGDETGHATLYSSAYNRADNRLSRSHLERHVEVCDVELHTLDEFLVARDIHVIDALKIDVQGSEFNVLRGALKTLHAGVRWMWIEFSPGHLRGAGSDPERFLENLGELGMDMFELTDDGQLRPVVNFREHTKKVGSTYGDLLLMSKEREMKRRSQDRGAGDERGAAN
jgi:FkbM family methyltransferase